MSATPEKTLAWHPMPNEPKGEMPVIDGWRDYGYDRRKRIAFDLERLEKRQKQPYDR
jgi:hypothetical protein